MLMALEVELRLELRSLREAEQALETAMPLAKAA